MTFSRKFALNTLIQIGGKIVTLFLGLFTVKLLTQTLGLDGFGEYTIIIKFLSIFGIIADLGLYIVLTTEMAEDDPEKTNKAVSNIFTLRCISAVLVVGIAAPLVSFLFPYSAEVKRLILFGSGGLIFMSFQQVLVGIFQKNLRTDKLIIGEFIGRLFLLASILYLAYTDKASLSLIIASFVIANLLQFIYIFINVRTYYVLSLKFDFTYWKYVLKQAFPLFIVMAFNLVYYQIDTVMLSIMKLPQDVGLYGVAYKVLEILITFPGMFVGLLLPVFTTYYIKDRSIFLSIFNNSFNILITAALPIAAGGFILAHNIILLISGPEFIQAAIPLQMLFIGIAFVFMSNLFSHILISTKFQNRIMFISITGAILNVLLNLIFIPKFSYTAAAINTTITEFTVLVLYIFCVYKFTHIRPRLNILHAKVLLATIIMSGIIYVLRDQNVIAVAVIGAGVYGSVLLSLVGLKTIKKDYVITI